MLRCLHETWVEQSLNAQLFDASMCVPPSSHAPFETRGMQHIVPHARQGSQPRRCVLSMFIASHLPTTLCGSGYTPPALHACTQCTQLSGWCLEVLCGSRLFQGWHHVWSVTFHVASVAMFTDSPNHSAKDSFPIGKHASSSQTKTGVETDELLLRLSSCLLL